MKVDAPSDTVYICTGPKAKVYHSTSKCRGLNRCSGDIKSISLKEAKKSRRACKMNGLLTYDREPKVPVEQIRNVNLKNFL